VLLVYIVWVFVSSVVSTCFLHVVVIFHLWFIDLNPCLLPCVYSVYVYVVEFFAYLFFPVVLEF
jgi:hypothetical protein